MRQKLLNYVRECYGTVPDQPFSRASDHTVLRHASGKWYGIIMELSPAAFGLPRGETVTVINLKCGALLIGSLLREPGFYPAYHMNKEHWISVRLDGTVPFDKLRMLLNISYDLTKPKRKRGDTQ